jgi:succinyl-CoA synthetase beta subunit
MKLFEYEGKLLLKKRGIPIPKGSVVTNLEEARNAANKIGYPVAIKSQILRGGRGQAGGIKFARNQFELMNVTHQMLTSELLGERIERLLIEEKLSISGELYVGITFDPQASLPVLVISAQGGMDIENLAKTSPHSVFTKYLDPLKAKKIYHVIDMVKQIGLAGEEMLKVAKIVLELVDLFFKYDAIAAEINPLAISSDGRPFAADCKIEIDDSAIFRVKEVRAFERNEGELDPLETEAKAAGISYVKVGEGNIGLIADGAGLGMASMDIISILGGKPANFLDLGGNATVEKTASALRIVLRTPGVQGIFINLFGGINNCEEMARGISNVIDEMRPITTIVVKMRGHSQESGWHLLESRQIPLVKFGTTEEAVTLLLKLMQKEECYQ